jgi:hypothetical protein
VFKDYLGNSVENELEEARLEVRPVRKLLLPGETK